MWIKEFSNFYMHANEWIVHQNIAYPSIEHFFVAMMTLDVSERLKIARLDHPAEAKKYGNTFSRRKDWRKIRRSVMLYALRQKFSVPSMKEALLSTGNHEIVHEVHWHDNFWASCVCPKCAGKEKVNLLGVLLIKVRAEFVENSNVSAYATDWHEVFYGTPCKDLS